MNAVVEDVAEYYPADGAEVSPPESRPKPRLHAINGAQKREINRLVAHAVRTALLESSSGQALGIDLMPVDRIELRWAVSQGTGFPSERYDETPIARPTPLDDDTAIIVDQINLRVPDRQQRLLRLWYRTQLPSSEIAKMFSTSRNGIYLEWRAALTWLKHAFMQSNHPELIRLVNLYDR